MFSLSVHEMVSKEKGEYLSGQSEGKSDKYKTIRGWQALV